MMDRLHRVTPDQASVVLQTTSSAARHRVLIVGDVTAKQKAFRTRLSEAARDLVIEGLSQPLADLSRRPDLVMWTLASPEAEPDNLQHRVMRLNDRFPRVPLVAVADRDDVRLALRALRQGFRGYVSSTLDPRVAVAALRLVLPAAFSCRITCWTSAATTRHARRTGAGHRNFPTDGA
ncbi:MAG TPA: hypothetical protein VH414_15120 [Lichenihabitans sp.]|jgi:DNA-binding NarL/FixJ family response regulator|nr:hypothetical protein [Lichenihabitans sp.]